MHLCCFLRECRFILVKVIKLDAVYRWVCALETKAGHPISPRWFT